MMDTVSDRDHQDCDGYTMLLMNAGAPKAARWLPMPMAPEAAANAAAEWATDTGCEVQLLYRGEIITRTAVD
ncbi:MAG: hypothetical protein H7Y60_10370 [Rhodospirillaceae bacterium]|nr:hypothetical protein [Rhodospirillales bacterium]